MYIHKLTVASGKKKKFRIARISEPWWFNTVTTTLLSHCPSSEGQGGENKKKKKKKLVSEEREITYHLLSWAKETQH